MLRNGAQVEGALQLSHSQAQCQVRRHGRGIVRDQGMTPGSKGQGVEWNGMGWDGRFARVPGKVEHPYEYEVK